MIQDLHRYDPRDKLKKMFAVAWTDGRICVCNIAKSVSNNNHDNHDNDPNLVEQYEWSVVHSFHTKYSFFQLNLLRFKNLNPIVEHSNRETETSLSNFESSDNLEAYWQSVHGDNDDDPPSTESAILASMADLFLVASSHSGHTLFISLIPTDFGEDITTTVTPPYERKIYSYDSRHALHSQVVKYLLIGHVNHISNPLTTLSTDSPQTSSLNSIHNSDSNESSHCLVYITGRGECWIVKDIESELLRFGPPTVPQIHFTNSDIEKANRIVRMWNIISSIPRNKMTFSTSELENDSQFHSDEPHNEGVALIQKLLSTSIEDLKQMVELTSLQAWKKLEG